MPPQHTEVHWTGAVVFVRPDSVAGIGGRQIQAEPSFEGLLPFPTRIDYLDNRAFLSGSLNSPLDQPLIFRAWEAAGRVYNNSARSNGLRSRAKHGELIAAYTFNPRTAPLIDSPASRKQMCFTAARHISKHQVVGTLFVKPPSTRVMPGNGNPFAKPGIQVLIENAPQPLATRCTPVIRDNSAILPAAQGKYERFSSRRSAEIQYRVCTDRWSCERYCRRGDEHTRSIDIVRPVRGSVQFVLGVILSEH